MAPIKVRHTWSCSRASYRMLSPYVDTILDHPTVDAMHVHPSRDNASFDRPINFQTQQRPSTHAHACTRQSTRSPGPPRQEGLFPFSAMPCRREILIRDSHCYSSSRMIPQRRSPCPISNSRSCRRHIHPSIASWITCPWAPLHPELFCLTLPLKVNLVVRIYC